MCNRNLSSAVIWASAMILIALGASTGVVEQDAARFLLVIMPALAFVTIRQRCAVRA